VPTGYLSAPFSITTTAVTTPTTANITATLGSLSQTATLTINRSTVLADSAWPKFHGNAQNSGLGGGSGSLGELKWSYSTGWIIGASSPSIGADGTVYIGSWDFNVYAFTPAGKIKWKFATGNFIFC